MANETLSTTLAGSFSADYLDASLKCYSGINAPVVLSKTLVAQIPARSGKILSIEYVTRDTAAAKTEGTVLNNTAHTSAKKQITAAEAGLLYNVSDFEKAINIDGDSVEDQIAMAAAEACYDLVETDLCSAFANASTSVNSTGVPETVADFIAAKVQLYTNLARGQMFHVVSPFALKSLINSAITAGGAFFGHSAADVSLLNSGVVDGYAGSLLGVPVYCSTHCPAVAGDTLGIMAIDSSRATGDPKMASSAVAVLWEPRVKVGPDVANNSDALNVTIAYGVGEVKDLCYVKTINVTS